MIHPADYYVIYQMGSPHGKKGDMTDKHQTEGKKLDRKRLLGLFQLDVAVHNFSFLLNIFHINY